jgi:hypothetical protein
LSSLQVLTIRLGCATDDENSRIISWRRLWERKFSKYKLHSEDEYTDQKEERPPTDRGPILCRPNLLAAIVSKQYRPRGSSPTPSTMADQKATDVILVTTKKKKKNKIKMAPWPS